MAINTFNVLDILLYIGLLLPPPWLGLEKSFKIKVLKMVENTILILVFENTVKISYTIVQQFYKQYITFNSSKIT